MILVVVVVFLSIPIRGIRCADIRASRRRAQRSESAIQNNEQRQQIKPQHLCKNEIKISDALHNKKKRKFD